MLIYKGLRIKGVRTLQSKGTWSTERERTDAPNKKAGYHGLPQHKIDPGGGTNAGHPDYAMSSMSKVHEAFCYCGTMSNDSRCHKIDSAVVD